MEFDDMKKIWDTQNNELLYGINETALHNRILSKKNQAFHITNISELLSIIVNLSSGCLILGINLYKQSTNISMYCLAGWMLITAAYLSVMRIRRLRNNNRFDRSLHGDLDHAISDASYQVRLSYLIRWNILPIGILSALGVWEAGKSVWIAVGILIFFALTNYASGWEHNIYKRKKRELEILQKQLENG